VFAKLLSPQLKYALWFLVVLRLCIPVTFESGLHLFTIDAASAPAVINTAPAVQQPDWDVVAPQVDVPMLDGGANAQQTQADSSSASKPESVARPLAGNMASIDWRCGFGCAWRERVLSFNCAQTQNLVVSREKDQRTLTTISKMQIRGRFPAFVPDINSPR
jgi:beta-lactamase regulating signal transducer with metallopeptidase domain